MPKPTSDARPTPATPLQTAEAQLRALGFKARENPQFAQQPGAAVLAWAAPSNRGLRGGEVKVLAPDGAEVLKPLRDVNSTDRLFFACPKCGYEEIARVELRERVGARNRVTDCRNCCLLGVKHPELAALAVGFDPMTVAARAKRRVQFRCSREGCNAVVDRWLHNQVAGYENDGVLPVCLAHRGSSLAVKRSETAIHRRAKHRPA